MNRGPITPKQRVYLEDLWRQLGYPTGRIPGMTVNEAMLAIKAALLELGLDEPKSQAGRPPAPKMRSPDYWQGFKDAQDDAKRSARQVYDKGYAEGYDEGYGKGHEDGYRSAGVGGDLAIRAARLSHPDRHPPERFAEANEVTAMLLALRNGNR